MDDSFQIIEKPTPPKNRCIILGSAIEEKYKIFINYLTIAKAMKHGLKDTINEMGGVLIGNVYSDKRIDDDFIYVDIKNILPVARVGMQKKFTFSEEELERLEEEVNEKYPDCKVLGWYHSHPGWGVELSDEDHETHFNFFNQNWSVLLLVESVAKDFAVFKTDDELQKAVLAKGYVVYCDTNDEIPKMKKLVDMVEQNRERKKDKEVKVVEKNLNQEENENKEIEEQDFYLNTLNPKVIITVLGSIILVLIIIIVVGKTKIDGLKLKAQQTQGSFSIETKDVQSDMKEIIIQGDFVDETIKVVVYPKENDKSKWKVKELYIKKEPSPYQLVARLEVPTPVSVKNATPENTVVETPSAEETPSVTPQAEGTPSSSPTVSAEMTPTVTSGDTEAIVKDKVKTWIDIWKTGDVEKFKSLYSKNFSNSEAKDIDGWIDNRVSARIFEGKPQIDIVGDIKVNVLSEDKVEVTFEQYFSGAFVSNGIKTLTFTKENSDWLISGEEFKP